MSDPSSSTAASSGPGLLFERVVVGVDDTPESLVAAAQARCLAGSEGHVDVVAVAETHLAAHAGFDAVHAADRVREQTRADLDVASDLASPDQADMRRGSLVDVLLAEADKRGATLTVFGAQAHGRLAARLFGGRDRPLLRRARTSVLIARPGWGPRAPRRVLVGVNGSPEARAAEEVARALGKRLGCEVTPVIALGDGPVDRELIRAERTEAVLDPRRAIDALVCAPEDALVVIGSATMRGTTTTHVAHEARCSVLVVRHPGPEL